MSDDKQGARKHALPPLTGSAVFRVTSIEAMAIKGMESRLRKLADQMDETAEALELCENNVGIEGASAKAEEMRGAANMAREWAQHILSQNVEARQEGLTANSNQHEK